MAVDEIAGREAIVTLKAGCQYYLSPLVASNRIVRELCPDAKERFEASSENVAGFRLFEKSGRILTSRFLP